MNRRHLVLGGLALGALGTAEFLRPRRRLILLQNGTIDSAMPTEFSGWASESASGLVSPEQAGKLAKSLYSEMVARTYYDTGGSAAIMVLAAYGDTQSDLLQLHRPETCYPAVGFTLRLSEPDNLAVGRGGVLPARRVVATTDGRTENIIYWTRIGETLPQSGRAQRDARLSNSMHGFVGDGVLMRCSMLGEPEATFPVLERFIPELLHAIPARYRKAFVGSQLALSLA